MKEELGSGAQWNYKLNCEEEEEEEDDIQRDNE